MLELRVWVWSSNKERKRKKNKEKKKKEPIHPPPSPLLSIFLSLPFPSLPSFLLLSLPPLLLLRNFPIPSKYYIIIYKSSHRSPHSKSVT
ncbi:hypothetical protein RIF29_17252 [Crotalaria pallida]|uniref:Uncharacterized protein n=1 Tax=Crotalaria pallida TaxID=3830 RepID=A0AAN9FGY3_CROPI